MSAPSSAQIVRLLADTDRRRVVAALELAGVSLSAQELAEAAAISLRAAVDAATRLVNGGLVEGDADGYALCSGVYELAAWSEAPDPAPTEHPDEPEDVARVLDMAFSDGKLVQWPSKRAKRLIVLDHMAQRFEIGTRYTEPQVNEILGAFDTDVATMRRYLVDERFMDRGEGRYWRCGGSV